MKSSAQRYSFLIDVGRVLADIFLITGAYLAAISFTPEGTSLWADQVRANLPYLVAVAVVWWFVATDQGLFMSRRGETLVAVLFSLAKTQFTTWLFSGFLLALFIPGGVNRQFFLVFALAVFAAMLAFTLVTRPSLFNLRRRGFNWRRILVIGANERTVHLVQVLLANEQYGYHLEGFLEDDPARRPLLEHFGVPCLGAIHDLERILAERVIDGVYISLPVRSFYESILNIAHLCEGGGVPVRLLADLFPLRMATSEVHALGDIPLLSMGFGPDLQAWFSLRRAVDLVAGGVLLVALSPLLLVLAVLIKLESRGPVLAFQDRLGTDLRPFRMFTFRVAPADAPVSERGEPTQFTRIGGFLRRYGLDELPMTLNVLLGQVSLIGPRPLVPAQGLPSAASVCAPERVLAGAAPSMRGRAGRRPPGAHVRLIAFATMDGVCIGAAYLAALAATTPSRAILPYVVVNYLPYLAVFILTWFGAAIGQRLWSGRPVEGAATYAAAVSKAVADAVIFCVFLVTVFAPEGLPRRFLVAFCVGTLVALLAFRLFLRLALTLSHRRGIGLRRAVIVGANERTAHLIEMIGPPTRYGCRLEGVLDDDAARVEALERLKLPYLGGVDDLPRVLADREIDEVYVSLPVRSHYEAIQGIARHCEEAGTPVHMLADLFPLQIATSRLMVVEDIPLVSLSPICEAQGQLALKRLVDIACSTALLAVFSPVFLLLAALIKLDSQGPVLFAQDRVGQNQRRFRMLKFRSMVANAEDLKKDIAHLNEADGPVFKIRNDPRITRIGGFLRKSSLDELPQLINVWRGEMSLVGPRPLTPGEASQCTWTQRRRLSVKPGMTGLWQVSGRSDLTFDQWIELDLAYIDSWSPVEDFTILLRTFKVVMTGRGAA